MVSRELQGTFLWKWRDCNHKGFKVVARGLMRKEWVHPIMPCWCKWLVKWRIQHKKFQHESCVKFSILIRISFELPNLQTLIEMVLVESSSEGEQIFFNWQSLYPPHLGGLPLNVVVYINFMFEIFKIVQKLLELVLKLIATRLTQGDFLAPPSS